jgi:hypothetical protein
MGALTLKSFPFILRSWNVKSYEFFDPTDSFGQETRVYINKNQVVKVEPQFSGKALHSWLTDKGRLFFDSLFGNATHSVSQAPQVSALWSNVFECINKTFYVFTLCNFKYVRKFFFILIFENVSIEIINFLGLISQLNPFIKIKRAEKSPANLNLETDFQISSATSGVKLASSSLCLLVGTNTRYEGSYLNLKLRQRYLKGNFRALILGSSLDLTFPVSFLGSNSNILKSVAEGNHASCKDVVNAVNPIFITSTEALKHNSVQEFFNIFNVLEYSNVLNEVWSGFNVLNSSLYDSSSNSFSRFSSLTSKDLVSFSSVYSLNVTFNNISNLHAVLGSRLLQHKSFNRFFNNQLFINQNMFNTTTSKFAGIKKHLYCPSNMFFENQETFLNTEGFRKISSKLILKKSTKSDWQVLRKLAKSFLGKKHFSGHKDNKILFYDSNFLFDFKNFMHFHFQATPNLTNLNEYLAVINQKFVLCKSFLSFKCLTVKLSKKKLSYWLDDFFTGGKDNFCQNSLTLVRCSSNYKLQTTNFYAVPEVAGFLYAAGMPLSVLGIFVGTTVGLFLMMRRSNTVPLVATTTLAALDNLSPTQILGDGTVGHYRSLLETVLRWQEGLEQHQNIDVEITDLGLPARIAVQVARFNRHHYDTLVNRICDGQRADDVSSFLYEIQTHGGAATVAEHSGSQADAAGIVLTSFEQALCYHVAELGVGFQSYPEAVMALKTFIYVGAL